MAEARAETKPGEAINYVLEGIDNTVKETLFTALEFYAKEKSESGNKIEDVVKVNKLRNAYNTLVTTIINTRLNDLNRHQKLFLCTGAISDVVDVNGTQVNLLDSKVYAELLAAFDTKDKNDPLADTVFDVLDKWKALSEQRLELIDTSGKRKKKKGDDRDPKKVKAELEWKRNDSLRAGANLIRTLGTNFDKIMQIDEAKLKNLKANYDVLNKYFTILQKGTRITPQEKQFKDAMATRVDQISKVLADFTKLYAETFSYTNESINSLSEKISDIKDKDNELANLSDVMADQASKVISSFKEDHAEIIKRDRSIVDSFIVTASEKASNRVPYSGARIMLNSQIIDLEKASTEYFCTPQNVMNSIKKILSFHVNAFPQDEDGNYTIPPILIEPIRNYCDFLEDRFIMGFISGEPGKKGANVSFSPIDFQVMKAIGMYLAKDPVYDYRGEINQGTFMGDYTGKIEKTAQVKWTGQEKKMNMVMSAELVDAASRDDAVADYMTFFYNALNGLGAPPKMSKRKINVLLKYALFKDIETTIKLLLQYVVQGEAMEARETILKYTNRNYDVAKDMIRKIVKEDQMIQRTLGNNPEVVIRTVFGA